MGLWATAKEMLLNFGDKANTELVLDHGGGFGRDLLTTITQVDVLTWLQPQLKRLTELCQQALQNSQQTVAHIEAVVLIGDWVELLAVQQTIAQAFQRPMTGLLTHHAALLPVYGAALATAANAATVRDVTPYALGINCYYGDVELFSPIILANTAIPTPPIGHANSFTENYVTRYPDQTAVGLTILQYRGERDPSPKSAKPVYPTECETLGKWDFSGLKPPFAIDGDGILQLYANETATGHHLQAQITRL
jgi:molecular chaperone DnaK (HSP70)